MTDQREPIELPPILELLTHDQGMKECAVSTSTAIHTIVLPDGRAFATIVFNQNSCPIGYTALLSPQEVDAHIQLLRNAAEDAALINNGKAPIHSAHSPAIN